MILRGHIKSLQKAIHNTPNFLFITNKKTKEMATLMDVSPHICVEILLQEEEFLNKFLHFTFLTKEIFFYELERTYQQQYHQQVEVLLKNTSYTTISPLGVAKTSISIINEESLEHLPITTILNPHFLTLHKMICSLKPLKALLLSIMHYYSFLLKDLEEFLILENLVICGGILDDKTTICKDIMEGIKYLENNKWIIHKEKLDFYLQRKGTFNSTFFYWKDFFQEASIHMCECPLVSSKEVEKFTYYHLKKQEYSLCVHKKPVQKRHICIPLENPTRISQEKKFYIENILGFKNPITPHRKEDTKMKTIKKNILLKELNLIY